METKLSLLCACPWAILSDFLNYCKDFVPRSVFPARDGKVALVDFAPDPSECVKLSNLISDYGKKDN